MTSYSLIDFQRIYKEFGEREREREREMVDWDWDWDLEYRANRVASWCLCGIWHLISGWPLGLGAH